MSGTHDSLYWFGSGSLISHLVSDSALASDIPACVETCGCYAMLFKLSGLLGERNSDEEGRLRRGRPFSYKLVIVLFPKPLPCVAIYLRLFEV